MATLQIIPTKTPDANKLEEAYEVAADLSITSGGKAIRVPRFFQYDGASIPAAAWQLIGTPFNPRFMFAAVFHDWLYHVHVIDDRKAVDELFCKLLVQWDVGKTKAWMMLQAVRLAGEAYWGNDPADAAYLKRLAKRIRDDGRKPEDYGM